MYYKRLLPEDYRMLTAIQSGASLGEVFATTFNNSAMDETAQAAILQVSFQQWAVLGWLCAPEQPNQQIPSPEDSE